MSTTPSTPPEPRRFRASGLDPARDALLWITGVTECGPPGQPGTIASFDAFPAVPWVHLSATGLGSFEGSAFPGDERAWAIEGACTIRSAGLLSIDIVYGTASADGFAVPAPAPGEHGPTTRAFDLSSNASIPVGAPIALPLVGRVGATEHLVRGYLP